MEHSKRIVTQLRKALAPAGLDVVIPLSVESYNAYLAAATPTAASDLTRFQLPIPVPPSSEQPRSSNLLVLVGNSRALWPPFLEFVRREMAQTRDGCVLPNPIDRFVQQSIHTGLRDLARATSASSNNDDCSNPAAPVAPTAIYWVADTEPGKMILAQKMALAAKQVSHCRPSQLCLHPQLGPWLAFRCALVFPVDGIVVDTSESHAMHEPPLCTHDDATHDNLASLMAIAFAQAKQQAPRTTSDTPKRISPSAWRAWVLPRLQAAPNHAMAYSPAQILYHYTKDLGLLARAARADQALECIDYVQAPPSLAVQECRRVVQQVLWELAAQHPRGIDAILLSGGLDTSILAEASDQQWPVNRERSGRHGDNTVDSYALSLDKHGAGAPLLRFTHALTLQAHAEAQDASFAAQIAARIATVSLTHHHVIHATLDELLAFAPRVTKLLATCDPMELRNSLVIYATLQRAAALGVQHVVTGDGADELFCGYAFYATMDEDALRLYRQQIATIMQFTASTLAASFNIRVTSPFLDPRVVALASSLTKTDLLGAQTPVPMDGGLAVHGKLALRQAFPESFSQWRKKEPIEAGAGTTALRLGYFDERWTPEEFAAEQQRIYRRHRVFVRDNEHLFFTLAFLDAFANDLSTVPKQRQLPVETIETAETNEASDESKSTRFCPACYFALSHVAQDFCVTCGFWPTRVTATNDAKGYATQALARLEQDKQRLDATE